MRETPITDAALHHTSTDLTCDVIEPQIVRLQEQLAAREVRIQGMKSAIQSVLCDPEGNPCFVGSAGDRQVIAEILEAQDDAPFLREHEAKVLGEAANEYARRYADPKLSELDDAYRFLYRMAQERKK